MTLATLINRTEKAAAKAEAAEQAAMLARRYMEAEARRIIWAALAKRGVAKGERIGFTDPKRARWYNIAPRLDRIEVWRGRDMLEKPEWRIRLSMATFSARGKPHLMPKYEHFEVQHPRDVARQIVKAMA